MNHPNAQTVQESQLTGTTGPEQLPVLYSRRAIEGFSFGMLPLWGAVMFAMNLRRLNRSDGVLPATLFGTGYLVAVIYLTESVAPKIPIHLWNGVGALIMRYAFWNKFIGKNVKFEKRKIWVPLLIAVVISTFFIWIFLASKSQ